MHSQPLYRLRHIFFKTWGNNFKRIATRKNGIVVCKIAYLRLLNNANEIIGENTK